MRAILIFLIMICPFILCGQVSKKHNPPNFCALAIDARIQQGDNRLPKYVVVNNKIWEYLKELQRINHSKKLDSLLNHFGCNSFNSNDKDDTLKNPRVIKANSILPYLKHTATIYKKNDWFLEASPIVFSKKRNEAIMVLRSSSKNEILDLCVYVFVYRGGKWTLSKEMSPFIL